MTLTAMKTKTEPRIYTRAMLIKLKIEVWGNSIQNKELAAEIAKSHGADPKMLKASQNKVDPVYLRPISDSARTLRGVHNYLTSPWNDDGTRILHVLGHPNYKAKMRLALDAHRKAVDDFCKYQYTEAVEESKRMLNGLAKYIDYPAADDIHREFSSGYYMRELPRSNDFRIDLPEEEIEEIVANNIDSDKDLILESAKHGYRELYTLVQHMSERLKLFVRVPYTDSKGQSKVRTENTFHETVVTNIEDFLRVLPGINFAEDKELDRIADLIRTDLCSYSAGTLKTDDGARESTLEAANEILERMSAYI